MIICSDPWAVMRIIFCEQSDHLAKPAAHNNAQRLFERRAELAKVIYTTYLSSIRC